MLSYCSSMAIVYFWNFIFFYFKEGIMLEVTDSGVKQKGSVIKIRMAFLPIYQDYNGLDNT